MSSPTTVKTPTTVKVETKEGDENLQQYLEETIKVQRAGIVSERLALQKSNKNLGWQVQNSKTHNAIILGIVLFLVVSWAWNYFRLKTLYKAQIDVIDQAAKGDYLGPTGMDIVLAYTYPWYYFLFGSGGGATNQWPGAILFALSTPAYANVLIADKTGQKLQVFYKYSINYASPNASPDAIVCGAPVFKGLVACQKLCKPVADGSGWGYANGIIGGVSQFGVVGGPFAFMGHIAGETGEAAGGPFTVAGGIIAGVAFVGGGIYGAVNHHNQVKECKASQQYCRQTSQSKC